MGRDTAKTRLDAVQNLRLNNAMNLRKTRSRLLRLLVKESPESVDLAFWGLIFRQLDSLGKDFEREQGAGVNDRLDKIERALYYGRESEEEGDIIQEDEL